MTDRQYAATRPSAATSILEKLREHAPNSAQVVGLATLVISGGILLLLSGLTLTATVLGLIFSAPLIIISSPIWVPVGFLIFVTISGALSFLSCGVALVAAVSWIYRYFRGLHPPGADRFDYARTRLADTAGHVKDYAREYGGYLQSKVKDAAPSA
ncbi:oleosin G [Salvia miltiorrhiza]|uniref:oleosin G n=1 Tax=Salvia miltiorrhiza TaxID=226208 RepID=UPI0025AC7CA8|nr:oleosin G [Salvia miltiorrhiza]